MAMGDALAKMYLRPGAVLLSHRFEFEQHSKAKFCIVLEDYDGGRETTIVALTTSNPQHRGKPWVVTIPVGLGGIQGGDGYLDCNNYFELPSSELAAASRYRYLGQLPEDLVEEIYLALEEAYKVPEALLVRIFGE